MTQLHPSLRIESLADHIELVPQLQEWFEQEWRPYYGPEGPGNALEDLRACCNRDQLPIALIALHNDELCGTAALKHESVSTHRHLAPWLAALLVAPEFRRRGIAERLIEAIEQRARRLGFERLHVGSGKGSSTPESALRARGWELVERAPYFIGEVSIFRKIL